MTKHHRLLWSYAGTKWEQHLWVGRVLAGRKHVDLVDDLHCVRAKGAEHEREVPLLRCHTDLSEDVLAQRRQERLWGAAAHHKCQARFGILGFRLTTRLWCSDNHRSSQLISPGLQGDIASRHTIVRKALSKICCIVWIAQLHTQVDEELEGRPRKVAIVGVTLILVTCFCRWMRRLKKEGRMWRSPSPNR